MIKIEMTIEHVWLAFEDGHYQLLVHFAQVVNDCLPQPGFV
jgi:hypothetical protein